jgi:hypothetical protein
MAVIITVTNIPASLHGLHASGRSDRTGSFILALPGQLSLGNLADMCFSNEWCKGFALRIASACSDDVNSVMMPHEKVL